MKKVKNKIKDIWRFPYKKVLSSKLLNENFSIISANCIGGVLCHDLFQEFRSPTVNLLILDFLKFCENLEYYLAQEPRIPKKIKNKNNWPEIYLDDIVILGVHYNSCIELKEKWENRAKRVNYKEIFIIGTDNFVKKGDLKRFDELKYPKILFTSSAAKEYEWQIYLPEFEGQTEMGDALRYVNIFGTRIFEKHFDCVEWLNENINFKS